MTEEASMSVEESAQPSAPSAATVWPSVPLPADAPRVTPGPTEPVEVLTARGPVRFQAELADTDAERGQGLMWRATMAPDRGMIFVFPRVGDLGFYMRNTYIPLDIIYIGADGRIVSIAKNTQPLNESTIPAGGPAQFVLEINAGLSDKLGITPGDRVTHRLLP